MGVYIKMVILQLDELKSFTSHRVYSWKSDQCFMACVSACVALCSWFVLSTHSGKVPGLNPTWGLSAGSVHVHIRQRGVSAGTLLSSHSAKTCMLCWLVTSSWSKETVWACMVVGVILRKQMHCSAVQPLQYHLENMWSLFISSTSMSPHY